MYIAYLFEPGQDAGPENLDIDVAQALYGPTAKALPGTPQRAKDRQLMVGCLKRGDGGGRESEYECA